MQRIPVLIVGAALSLGPGIAQSAGGDPAAGERKSQTCASCHGERGAADNSQYPLLAGQHESYLYQALKQYKSGARDNAVMAGMVSNLSDRDMRDLAAYYAAQDGGVYTLPLNATAE